MRSTYKLCRQLTHASDLARTAYNNRWLNAPVPHSITIFRLLQDANKKMTAPCSLRYRLHCSLLLWFEVDTAYCQHRSLPFSLRKHKHGYLLFLRRYKGYSSMIQFLLLPPNEAYTADSSTLRHFFGAMAVHFVTLKHDMT